MHELFNKVLAKRDLSRAGDLFSVPDADIVDDITEVVGYLQHCSQIETNCMKSLKAFRDQSDHLARGLCEEQQ